MNNVYAGFCLGPTDDSQCVYCISEQNYGDGIHLTGSYQNPATAPLLTLQWGLIYALSQENEGWGIYFTGPTNSVGTANIIQGTPWIGTQTFANNSGGICMCAPSGGQINDVTFYGVIASTNNYTNIVLLTHNGQNAVLQGGLDELAGMGASGRNVAHPASHTGSGLEFDTHDISVSGMVIQGNSYNGIADNSATGIVSASITGNKIVGNGTYSIGGTPVGISLTNATAQYLIVGNQGSDSVTQHDGLFVQNGSNVSVTSNTFGGTVSGCVANTGTFKGSGNFGAGCP